MKDVIYKVSTKEGIDRRESSIWNHLPIWSACLRLPVSVRTQTGATHRQASGIAVRWSDLLAGSLFYGINLQPTATPSVTSAANRPIVIIHDASRPLIGAYHTLDTPYSNCPSWFSIFIRISSSLFKRKKIKSVRTIPITRIKMESHRVVRSPYAALRAPVWTTPNVCRRFHIRLSWWRKKENRSLGDSDALLDSFCSVLVFSILFLQLTSLFKFIQHYNILIYSIL